MNLIQQLEAVIVRELGRRGLRRARGAFAFVHRGIVVRISVRESVYRGVVVTVHDEPNASRQFRARGGTYDWDGIATAVLDVVESRNPTLPGTPVRAANDARDARFSMQPSPASPGRVRVRLSEMDLDTVSALQLYELVRHALPTARHDVPERDVALI